MQAIITGASSRHFSSHVNKVKVKVKITLEQATKAQRGVKV
jgi:hypothetical protein